MKPITKSRNKREGHYAGRSNWDREYGRHQGPLRHMRTGQQRPTPHGHHLDSWSCE